VRAAPQPTANAASSADPRLHRYCPAGRGSNHRPRRPDPAFAHPLAGPVSPDTSNPTMPAQPSPRACAHVVSARKWTYYHWAAHQPDQPAGAQGCGRHSLICDTPDRVRPLLRIAATAVHCLPKLVAASLHVLPSANGLCVSVAVRQPIPTSAGANPWRVAWVPCAAYIPPGMHHPGARSTHRPQAVVIPRLSNLCWPRMRGLAPVRSHYARIPNHLRFA
jgi:hypothetical protein